MNNKKVLLKTITYRLLGTTFTVVASLYFGLTIEWAALLGATELVAKPILYFFHEKFWDFCNKK